MLFEATNAWKRGHIAVTWFKRYLVVGSTIGDVVHDVRHDKAG
ncbi:hypothetical protein [Bradyrhizobium guangzhouense]|nr:hypothetical protein [Bradyrhizobium guangzhouense]